MTAAFNSYHEWLGIDQNLLNPNYFQLLGIDESEERLEVITAAADRALSRVRSFIPGPHASAWAALLDELSAAKRCLLDASQRAEYRRLRRDAHRAEAPSVLESMGTDKPTGAPSLAPPAPPPPALQTTPTAPPASHVEEPPSAPNSNWASAAPWPTAPGPTAAWGSAWGADNAPIDPMAPVTPTHAAASSASSSTGFPTPVWPTATPMLPPGYGYQGMPAPGSFPTPSPYPPSAPVAMAAPLTAPMAAPMAAPLAGPYAAGPYAAGPYAAGPYAAGPYAAGMTAPLAAPLGMTTSPSTGPLLIPDRPTDVADASAGNARAVATRPNIAHVPSQKSQAPLFLIVGAVAVAVLLVGLVVAMNADSDGGRGRNSVAMQSASNGLNSANHVSSSGPPVKKRERPGFGKSGVKPRKTTVAIENDGSESDGDRTGMTSDGNGRGGPSPDPTTPDSANPEVPSPAKKPEGEPKPDAPPEPSPEPKPSPKPEMKPEPAPEPKPAPKPAPPSEPKPEPKPAPAVRPTKAEAMALAKHLASARTAISEQQYDVAGEELTKAEQVAKMPEHLERVERLKRLNHYAQEFRRALRESVKGLKGGQPITVKSTVVAVVETFPNEDRIILRVAGNNRTYTFDGLPIGLAVAIADLWLDQKDPTSLFIKSCYVLAHKSATDDMRAKGQTWLDEAQSKIPQIVDPVSPVFEDKDDEVIKDAAP